MSSGYDGRCEGACVHIIRWLTLSLIVAASGGSAWPQALSADFVHGVDYAFQRMEATRTVRDADESVSDKYSAADNQQRMDVQRKLFVQAGREKRVSSLWIYAARDQLYGEATTREFFHAYQEAGGHGDYVFVSEHALPNGHNLSTVSSLWETAVDAFLTKLDGPNAP
jgi:hypothetical protein